MHIGYDEAAVRQRAFELVGLVLKILGPWPIYELLGLVVPVTRIERPDPAHDVPQMTERDWRQSPTESQFSVNPAFR